MLYKVRSNGRQNMQRAAHGRRHPACSRGLESEEEAAGLPLSPEIVFFGQFRCQREVGLLLIHLDYLQKMREHIIHSIELY